MHSCISNRKSVRCWDWNSPFDFPAVPEQGRAGVVRQSEGKEPESCWDSGAGTAGPPRVVSQGTTRKKSQRLYWAL